jgi:DNA repair exonuclease SbcCD nuclease subunit
VAPFSVRILFLSDTHLGIDMPSRPRVERRRRGDDFFANFERAIEPPLSGESDVLIHGGDLFYRSRIPAWLADRVFERLATIADRGVDIFLVPGNHERSVIPRSLLLTHPGIRVFDTPRTFVINRQGIQIAIVGLPYSSTIRNDFSSLLQSTRYLEHPASIRLLCLHQLVEGAKVGPVDFTFRSGEDVLLGAQIPAGFAAVLSGHVHRFQVLETDLARRPLRAPFLYAGSIERTSFAEKLEPKGFLMLDVAPGPKPGGSLVRWEFRQLPARPMVDLELPVTGTSGTELTNRVKDCLSRLDPESVVRIRIVGNPSQDALSALGASALRALAPPTMNVSLAWPGFSR